MTQGADALTYLSDSDLEGKGCGYLVVLLVVVMVVGTAMDLLLALSIHWAFPPVGVAQAFVALLVIGVILSWVGSALRAAR